MASYTDKFFVGKLLLTAFFYILRSFVYILPGIIKKNFGEAIFFNMQIDGFFQKRTVL